jgi:HEPN/Toprim N-terminal domain 1
VGTEITLEVEGLTVDYSKNFIGTDHGALFQDADRKRIHSDQINYEYFKEHDEDPAPMEMAFVRKLKDTLPRLDLLGFTQEQGRIEYLRAVETAREEINYDDSDNEMKPRNIMSFDEFLAFVAAHPIATLDDTYDGERNDEENKGQFSGDPTIQRLPYPSYDLFYSERSYFGNLIRFLHPYFVLRLLAASSHNLEADVVWQYGPLVENGWAKENQFTPCARRFQTFLVATEGSSDAHILKHAISILRPEVADFFRFIDVKEGHPFPGAGSLVKFAEGLAKIDVHNQIVFLFDNDGEGLDAWRRVQNLSLPPNMRAIMLPELDEFRSFPARGPQGIANTDINKRAASIECYLDLNNAGRSSPRVVWTNYKKDLDLYHGALDKKEVYTRAFLKLTAQSIATNAYDLKKMRAVLDALVAECCSIAVTQAPIDPVDYADH